MDLQSPTWRILYLGIELALSYLQPFSVLKGKKELSHGTQDQRSCLKYIRIQYDASKAVMVVKFKFLTLPPPKKKSERIGDFISIPRTHGHMKRLPTGRKTS